MLSILGYTVFVLLAGLGGLFIFVYVLYIFDTKSRLKLEHPWSEYPVKLPQNKEKISLAFYIWGSRGDLQPLAVLACYFQEHGHSVLINVRERYHQTMLNLGLKETAIFPQKEDYSEEIVPPLIQGKTGPEPLFHLFNHIAKNTEDYFYQLCEMVEKLDADVIVVNEFATSIGYLVAEKYQLPLFIYRYTPIFSPTTEWECPFFSDYKNKGSFFNWFSYLPPILIKWFVEKRIIRKLRRDNNLPSRSHLQQLLGSDAWQFPAIWAFSNLMMRYPQKDIPAWYFNTGPILPPAQEQTEKVPESLIKFLADTPENEPIIYIGFGSFSITNFLQLELAKKSANTILEALAELGIKAVILKRTFDFMIEDPIFNNPQWYVGESFPHSWLFPKVSVIVHQAGAGHCAASARSGTPTIVMPAFEEQMYNARTLLSLKIAVQVFLAEVTKESFKTAFHQALTLKENAQMIGDKFEQQVQQAGNIAVSEMLKWLDYNNNH
ncbi:MAG TPA: glycosyltransferase [Nostocaceae cyanobacterium]|nr:glycosyltransferase [Nostocaceae cyanobacterium]